MLCSVFCVHGWEIKLPLKHALIYFNVTHAHGLVTIRSGVTCADI